MIRLPAPRTKATDPARFRNVHPLPEPPLPAKTPNLTPGPNTGTAGTATPSAGWHAGLNPAATSWAVCGVPS